MGRRSKEAAAAAAADARRRAEELRAAIRQRSAAFGGTSIGLLACARASTDMAPLFATVAAVLMVAFFCLRRGWMREYRDALSAAGVDPERDELVESSAGAVSMLLILFGVFGGMFVFLGVFIWLAGR